MRTGRILGSYAPAYSLCCSAQELDGAARGSWIPHAGRSYTRKGPFMLPNFEALFGIPPHHRLFLVRSRGRGGLMWGEYWTHEEVDVHGNVIARYESYEEVDAHGHARRGWRKFDSLGKFTDLQTVSESWSVQSRNQPPFAA